MLVGLVLAAGMGTRLRPFTETLPKPLMPVDGERVLGRHVRQFAIAGASKVFVNTFHHADQVADYLEAIAPDLSVDVETVPETELLGTAGSLRRVADRVAPTARILVANSDTWHGFDLGLLVAHHESTGADVTLCTQEKSLAIPGRVIVDDGRVVGDLPGGDEPPVRGRAVDFVGVHVVDATVARRLPERGCLLRQGYGPARGSLSIQAYEPTAERWWDVGTPEALLEANLFASQGQPPVPDDVSLPPGSVLERSLVLPGVRLSRPVVIRDAILGATEKGIASWQRAHGVRLLERAVRG